MRTEAGTGRRAVCFVAILATVCSGLAAGEASAQVIIGRVKTVKGTVDTERDGRREATMVGAGVRQATPW